MFKKIAVLALMAGAASQVQAQQLTVVSFGGLNKQAQEKRFTNPSPRRTTSILKRASSTAKWPRSRPWSRPARSADVVEVESPELVRGCSEGLFEPLDWSKLGDKKQMIDSAASECGAGIFIWSTVLAYDSTKLAKAPAGWADFWDVKTYPGKRALRKVPSSPWKSPCSLTAFHKVSSTPCWPRPKASTVPSRSSINSRRTSSGGRPALSPCNGWCPVTW